MGLNLGLSRFLYDWKAQGKNVVQEEVRLAQLFKFEKTTAFARSGLPDHFP